MGAVALTPLDIALAAVLLIVPAAISLALRLGLGRRLLLAGIRSVLQLGFLGLVLEWVFDLDRWYFVVPLLVFMIGAAARAAVGRSSRDFAGARWLAFGSLVLATSVVAFTATELVVGVDPWYRPQYVIPLVGMLLGNGLTGISLALDRLLEDLETRRPSIEARLALGMPLPEAVRPWVRESVRTGMIPILNTMVIVGLVSLPGMMTGQILAGADPSQAVAYQILILFMIASATSLGTMLIAIGSARLLGDPEHRLRWSRIRVRES